MEYCYHVWAGAPSCYLELLDKLQNGYAELLVLHLPLLLNTWLIVGTWPAQVFPIGIYYFGRCSSELAQLVPFLFWEGGQLVILIDCMVFLSPFLDVTRVSMSTVSFLTQLDSGILCL